MARKGKNRTGKRNNNSNNFVENKQNIKTPAKVFYHPTRSIIEKAYTETFFSHGKEWRGLQCEHPANPTGAYTEITYYLDELEDEKLYEETFRKMLKKLKVDEKITSYELIRQPVTWDEEQDCLVLRAK